MKIFLGEHAPRPPPHPQVEEDGKAKKHPEARDCQEADRQLEVGEVEGHQGRRARLLLTDTTISALSFFELFF